MMTTTQTAEGAVPGASREVILVLIGCVLMELAFLSLHTGAATRIEVFICSSLIASVLYAFIAWVLLRPTAGQVRERGALLWIIFGAALIFRLTLIGIGPVASGDVFRYIWDGKVMAHGMNPYAYAPTDPALNHLHSTTLPAILEFAAMPTIYPPMAEWVFAASYYLAGENVLGIKLFLLLAEGLTCWLMVLALRKMHRPPVLAGLYALCPLPAMQFMNEAHADALAFPALAAMMLFFVEGKQVKASASAGIAVLFKLLPALAVPVLWRSAPPEKRMRMLLVPAVLVTVCYLPYLLWRGHPFDALGAYSSRWYFNGILFDGVLALTGSNELSHGILGGLFVLWFLWCMRGELAPASRLMKIFIGYFLLSATIHPWYLTWLAVLLPFAFNWTALVWLVTVNLANIVYIDYLSNRIWRLSPGWELLEYVPVFAALVWEFASKSSKPLLSARHS